MAGVVSSINDAMTRYSKRRTSSGRARNHRCALKVAASWRPDQVSLGQPQEAQEHWCSATACDSQMDPW